MNTTQEHLEEQQQEHVEYVHAQIRHIYEVTRSQYDCCTPANVRAAGMIASEVLDRTYDCPGTGAFPPTHVMQLLTAICTGAAILEQPEAERSNLASGHKDLLIDDSISHMAMSLAEMLHHWSEAGAIQVVEV